MSDVNTFFLLGVFYRNSNYKLCVSTFSFIRSFSKHILSFQNQKIQDFMRPIKERKDVFVAHV